MSKARVLLTYYYFSFDVFVLIIVINRIIVGLPSLENREKILKTLLAKEKVDQGLDIKELATMTEGYSGSDLKVVCCRFVTRM